MRTTCILLAFLALTPLAAASEAPPDISTLRIARINAGIDVDGTLDDAAWAQATRTDVWYETNPGDNSTPAVASTGYLAYDGKYLYAGFEFADPNPDRIRAPLRDRDNVPRDHDYGGVIIDPSNGGRTAIELLANARGVQFDAVYDDTAGSEDTAPDFFWDAAARIHERGWTLEMRIPFSSLRYPDSDPQTWRIMLYRNYPRDFRYQFFTTPLPRGRNCFICYSNRLVGLESLPSGGGVVFAPYGAGNYEASASEPGMPLENAWGGTGGFDAKWRPDASNVVDVTVNPDFSQIESDVARITANERFALSFPEKRPFFLEGSELLATPIQAVHTRTMTDPVWGARGTGRIGRLSYTALAVQDEGGGSVIIPRRNSSELVDQDFRSWAGVARTRLDLGPAFVSLLGTGREIAGGGHNYLVGPDFEWRLGERDVVAGQALVSSTRTPVRPELFDEWDGRNLTGHAGRLHWRHSGTRFDWNAIYLEVGDEFRADNGFVPQAGFREGYGELGITFRPESGPFRRLRPFVLADRMIDLDEQLLFQQLSAGANTEGLWSSMVRVAYAYDQILTGDTVLPRHQAVYGITVSPSIIVSRIELGGSVGQQIDFDNGRTGLGGDVNLGLTLQPTPHLELVLNESLRRLDVRADGARQRLFIARVDRLRATYSFTSRLFLRAIAQYEVTRRDPALYTEMVPAKEASFSGSALFAYKLNWQSVMFIGYGDGRVFSEMTGGLAPSTRQLFLKFSYAFQY